MFFQGHRKFCSNSDVVTPAGISAQQIPAVLVAAPRYFKGRGRPTSTRLSSLSRCINDSLLLSSLSSSTDTSPIRSVRYLVLFSIVFRNGDSHSTISSPIEPERFTLHKRYGPVVRLGPAEILFSSLSAQRQIYGGFERTSFYRMFDVYGRQNLFTISSTKDHSRRKKMLHHAYSKTAILNFASSDCIVQRVDDVLNLIEKSTKREVEIYSAMLFYSLDITHFLYGAELATHALRGNKAHQSMLDDQRDPARRKMAWFSTHMKWYVRWLANQTGAVERVLDFLGFYPQRKPFVYTGIREYALKVYYDYKPSAEATIIGRLKSFPELDDLDIASECADHFLAGINTTADTLFFMLWILSRPENKSMQDRLIDELHHSGLRGTPSPKDLSRANIPYFDVVVQETLRLYAPLPASEPRVSSKHTQINNYLVPAHTIISCQPYTLHRNPSIFTNPETFLPERWLSDDPELKRRWWAFSSGGRMCIGEQYCLLWG